MHWWPTDMAMQGGWFKDVEDKFHKLQKQKHKNREKWK